MKPNSSRECELVVDKAKSVARTLQRGTIVMLATSLLIIGCSRSHVPIASEDTPHSVIEEPVQVLTDPGQNQASAEPVDDNVFTAYKSYGSGSYVRVLDDFNDSTPSSKGNVTFNFEQAPLRDVVESFLGEVLDRNYLIEPGVEGNITFSTARPMHRDTVMSVLESLLSVVGAAIIDTPELVRVVPITDAVAGRLRPSSTASLKGGGYRVVVVPLDYIAATEMASLLEPFVRSSSILSIDDERHVLILAGTREELDLYIDTIAMFDVDWLVGVSVGIFPIGNVSVTDLVTDLQQLFKSDDGATTTISGIRFVPMERLGSLMVLARQPHQLDQAEEWIKRLDKSVRSGDRQSLYVIEVLNVEATVLAATLNGLFADWNIEQEKPSLTSTDIGQIAPTLELAEISSNVVAELPTATATRSYPDIQQQASASVARITAVEESNSLLVVATPSQYRQVVSAIQKLDTIPLQVLVEVQIIEVTLNDQLEFGVQWFLKDDTNNSRENFTFGLPVPGANASSFAYDLITDDVTALIRALDSLTSVNVLSAPTLMVLNNHTANINVGDQIPVVTTTFNESNDQPNTISTVQFRDTGVILDVKPRVNPGGMVYLDISQEVSDPGDIEPITGNREVLRRTIQTSVAVQSGSTVILGGLIRRRADRGRSGIPVLSRIPGIGGLFGRRKRDNRNTELLVTIKPSVVKDNEQARSVTLEYAERLEAIKKSGWAVLQ
ncbi:MAG: type II secretion system protein GspD [marine bacterium B5-7]|nr:MAG: type II secretion system protein GspD [marine bacterium B5-7]